MKINGKYVPITVEKVLQDVRRDTGLLRNIEDKGDFLMVTCPFHGGGTERTPSMGINTKSFLKNGVMIEEGYAHCFGCGYKGRFTKFLGDVLGINEFEVLKLLKSYYISDGMSSREISLDLGRDKSSKEEIKLGTLNEEGKKYLHKRKIGKNAMELFKVFSEGKNVSFPLIDKNGNIIGQQQRSIEGKHFYNDKGLDKMNFLYGLYQALQMVGKGDNKIYVVESIIDCLTLWEWGYKSVALMGAKISDWHLKELSLLPYEIVIATDNDEAGRKVGYRLYKLLESKGIRAELFKWQGNVKDINELTKEQFEKIIK